MEIINTKRDAWPCVSFFGGTDGNRTSDTRIFSPLLYQLSYGTSVSGCKNTTNFVIGKKNSSKKENFLFLKTFLFEIQLDNK